MSIVASEEMSELPTYVSQCCAVYIPEVGYLLAVGLWRENLSEEEVKIDHLEFRVSFDYDIKPKKYIIQLSMQ